MRDYAFVSLVVGAALCFGGMLRNVFYNDGKGDKWGWFVIGGPLFLYGFGYAVAMANGWV